MKKVLIGAAAAFVILETLDFLIHDVILASSYSATPEIWRPDMMDVMWVLHIVKIVTAFFFALIFSKGYEGKGTVEGIRYGLYVGVMMSVGMAYGTYTMIAISPLLAFQWFLFSVFEYIIAGIGVSLVYGKRT
ncbi:MAG: hypothetical protein JXA06_13165 [Bacteroidetes bacterium]|nr:hypothetical protein [Bacteroidota bacterium]